MNYLKVYKDFKNQLLEKISENTVNKKFIVSVKDKETNEILKNVQYEYEIENSSDKIKWQRSENGEFEVPIKGPGVIVIRARCDGYYDAVVKKKLGDEEDPNSVLGSPDESFSITVYLKKTIKIKHKFKVTDKDSGEAIESAKVGYIDDSDNVIVSGETNDNGEITLIIPDQSSYNLRCLSPGYKPYETTISTGQGGLENLTEEEIEKIEAKNKDFIHEIDIEMEKLDEISPRVEEPKLKMPKTVSDEVELDASFLDKFIIRCPNLKAVMEEYKLDKKDLKIFVYGGTQNNMRKTQPTVYTKLKSRGFFGNKEADTSLKFAHKISTKFGYNDSYNNLLITKTFKNKKMYDEAIANMGKELEFKGQKFDKQKFIDELRKVVLSVIGTKATLEEVVNTPLGYQIEILGLNPQQTLDVLAKLDNY